MQILVEYMQVRDKSTYISKRFIFVTLLYTSIFLLALSVGAMRDQQIKMHYFLILVPFIIINGFFDLLLLKNFTIDRVNEVVVFRRGIFLNYAIQKDLLLSASTSKNYDLDKSSYVTLSFLDRGEIRDVEISLKWYSSKARKDLIKALQLFNTNAKVSMT